MKLSRQFEDEFHFTENKKSMGGKKVGEKETGREFKRGEYHVLKCGEPRT